MSEAKRALVLTARTEGRNERHAQIGVFQNGGKAGVLTVDAEQEAAVLGAINSHADLLAACKAAHGLACGFDGPPGHKSPVEYAALVARVCHAAIAKGKGKSTMDEASESRRQLRAEVGEDEHDWE